MMELDAGFLAVLLHEFFEEAIAPRPRRLGQERFDALDVDLGDRARIGLNDEEPAGERRVGDVVVDLGVASFASTSRSSKRRCARTTTSET